MIKINIGYAWQIATQIAKLENSLFNNDLERIYKVDKQIKVLYCLDKEKIVAFTTFKRNDRQIEIYNLGVDRAYQNQGYGSMMLCKLKSFDCSLEVRRSNQKAIAFYSKNGFTESFIRRNYYGNEDAIVLERYRMITEKAYAKINLVLNVLSREETGYHQIEFLMNKVNIYDEVTIEKSNQDEAIVLDNDELSNLDNLAYTALTKMREKYGFKSKYKITIKKNIPVAAGMAGGSSDAAAVLRGINELEGIGASLQELADIGATFGSDISFCVYSSLAIARGRGEQIELIENKIPTKYLLVINPGVPLSTAIVYTNHKINSELGVIDDVLNAKNHTEFETALSNSLAKIAYELCPEMVELYEKLQKNTNNRILVSGSGPTLLVFSESKSEIEELYDKFKGQYSNIHIAQMN